MKSDRRPQEARRRTERLKSKLFHSFILRFYSSFLRRSSLFARVETIKFNSFRFFLYANFSINFAFGSTVGLRSHFFLLALFFRGGRDAKENEKFVDRNKMKLNENKRREKEEELWPDGILCLCTKFYDLRGLIFILKLGSSSIGARDSQPRIQ
jgi:hypothetical protein